MSLKTQPKTDRNLFPPSLVESDGDGLFIRLFLTELLLRLLILRTRVQFPNVGRNDFLALSSF